MAVIGFNQTAYTFEEGDGTVEVCAAFLEPRNPSRIAPNVVVELTGSTSPSTYSGCCVHVYNLQWFSVPLYCGDIQLVHGEQTFGPYVAR